MTAHHTASHVQDHVCYKGVGIKQHVPADANRALSLSLSLALCMSVSLSLALSLSRSLALFLAHYLSASLSLSLYFALSLSLSAAGRRTPGTRLLLLDAGVLRRRAPDAGVLRERRVPDAGVLRDRSGVLRAALALVAAGSSPPASSSLLLQSVEMISYRNFLTDQHSSRKVTTHQYFYY